MKILTPFLFISLCALLIFASSCTPTNPLTPNSFVQPSPTPPDVVTLSIQNYSPSAGNTYSDVYVSNFSIKPLNGKLYYSTSRDGLTDQFKNDNEVTFAFNPIGPYTNITDFSDFFLYLAGITATQKSLLFCDANHQGNTAQDGFTYIDNRQSPPATVFLGLRDCEKLYMGMNVNLFDNNKNGVPDYLKLRCGLNPLNTHDSTLSIANDKTIKQKCKLNVPSDESLNANFNSLFAYNYTVSNQGLSALGSASLNITVSNIPVFNKGQDNFIAIYIIENNNATNNPVLSSAFMILPGGSSGRTFTFNYWYTGAPNTSRTNQQVVVQ